MDRERSPKRQKVVGLSKEGQRSDTVLATTPPNNIDGGSAVKQTPHASWYNSFSRKAPPVTELARESFRVQGDSSPEPRSSNSPAPRSIRSPSLAMALGKKQSNWSLPADATTTKVNAEAGSSARKDSSASALLDKTTTQPPDQLTEQKCTALQKPSEEEKEIPNPVDKDESKETPAEANTIDMQQSSWLGWLGKGDVSSNTQNQPPTKVEDQKAPNTPAQDPPKPQESTTADPDPSQQSDVQKGQQSIRRSWLPWANVTEESGDKALPSSSIVTSETIDVGKTSQQQQQQDNNKQKPTQSEPQPIPQPTATDTQAQTQTTPSSNPQDEIRASAWAFWSRERRANLSTSSIDAPRHGEIAISDTPSQNQPKQTSIEPPGNSNKKSSESGTSTPTKSSQDSKKPKAAPSPIKVETPNVTAVAQEPTEQKPTAPPKSAKVYQNVLLPDFHSTLKLPENPSIIQQLSRLLYVTKEPKPKHLSLVKDSPRIKNALAIGVHGYFPAPLIRTVLGQPTGTSIKFADMAAKSIRRWTAARGYECQVKTAALEGEGKIADRVELLWKLLLNWIEEIRKSDFVLIACHSQGVPVAIMLVAKLIQFGCLQGARVGICAMAGVSMGPFTEYKSRWISGSAGELFEFSDANSKVSKDYLAALEVVLKAAVRVTFIGSIDDQLVSLESSIFSSVSHPQIYRAVSIDARLQAPNFLSHLVGFALKLRNLGIQDHGLIRELSSPLAGSLYTGDGHSRLYESENCYDLAVDWALLTTSAADAPVVVSRSNAIGASNPYILPFAMRGILEEDFVKTELHGEASQLLEQFDEWKPTTKVLKDVKFRLEGIRSKL